jgi:hypothetical protein
VLGIVWAFAGMLVWGAAGFAFAWSAPLIVLGACLGAIFCLGAPRDGCLTMIVRAATVVAGLLMAASEIGQGLAG